MPETLESFPLERPELEYCYQLEFPLQEKKECFALCRLQSWDSNANLALPARPQGRAEHLAF